MSSSISWILNIYFVIVKEFFSLKVGRIMNLLCTVVFALLKSFLPNLVYLFNIYFIL
jgi:hypothetical protein